MGLFTQLALSLCLSFGAVQDPAPELRGFALGEARLADGRPWAGAEVVLLARPLGRDADAGAVDRVVATADERGRFRAAILRGRPYSAWAWGEPTAAGRAASAVHEQVFVQQPIVLRCERNLPVRELVLEHVERWPEAAWRVRILDELGNCDVHQLDVPDGRVRLPWLVAASATVELFAVRGTTCNPLLRRAVAAAPGELRLEVPQRQRVTCFVRSAADDTPLVDTRVYRLLGRAFHLAGRTDAAGTLAFDAPVGTDADLATLVEGDDGRMGLCLPIAVANRLQNVDVPAGAQPHDLLCRIPAGRKVHARFAVAGMALAGADIVQAGMAVNRPSRSSFTSLGWSRTLRTGDDGSIALVGSDGSRQVDAHLLLRERDLAALPAPWRQGLAPVVFAPLSTATGTGHQDDPFLVDLAKLCPIELSFTGPGGTPLANVAVRLASLGAADVACWPHRDGSGAIADERGRVRLLVPAGQRLGLAATHGMSLLVRAFVTTPGRAGAGPATATFELPAPTGIRGRLFGKDGLPAAQRRVHASFGTDNAPALWDFASEPEAKLETATGNALRVLLPDDGRELLRLTGLIGTPVETDADGRFALPLPAVPVPGLLLFQGTREARSFFDSRTVAWTGAAIDEFEWTVRF